jgi:glucosamine-6-phosphate deaminase
VTGGRIDHVDRRDLERWCRIPADELAEHGPRVPFRIAADAGEMARLMALELVDLVGENEAVGRATRAIVPCGPTGWYAPFTREVNERRVSLRHLTVFHMDECLDWQGRPLPDGHPYNFRAFMERSFYGGIDADLSVPEEQRLWLLPSTAELVAEALAAAPIDITLGGWGQDGHVAYNQARRRPYSPVTLEELADSTIRIQENNDDTILALAHRTFGGAYQFAPPMSITLGLRECLSARRVRVFSDTGAWKQTAFRVALFSDPTPEYPITLLQTHADALLTATRDTATHPLSEHPEWEMI